MVAGLGLVDVEVHDEGPLLPGDRADLHVGGWRVGQQGAEDEHVVDLEVESLGLRLLLDPAGTPLADVSAVRSMRLSPGCGPSSRSQTARQRASEPGSGVACSSRRLPNQ